MLQPVLLLVTELFSLKISDAFLCIKKLVNWAFEWFNLKLSVIILYMTLITYEGLFSIWNGSVVKSGSLKQFWFWCEALPLYPKPLILLLGIQTLRLPPPLFQFYICPPKNCFSVPVLLTINLALCDLTILSCLTVCNK